MNETDALRELYQDMILDHGKHPRNFHVLEGAQCEAVGHNPLCGDKLVLFVKAGEDGRIEAASFQGEGCSISVASASIMTDILPGKTVQEAKDLLAYFEALTKGNAFPEEEKARLDADDLARLQALAGVRHYPVRVKCAMLAWRTLESALDPQNAVAIVKTEEGEGA